MKKLAIAGVGLIGGSFALALRAAGVELRIAGIDLGRSLEAALQRGVIDEILPLAQACAEADIVFLALPIGRILDLLPQVAAHCGPRTLVTDVGSTKSEIVRCAAAMFRQQRFLGGHPMAGKETRGVGEADPALFMERPYLLTPSSPDQMESPEALLLLEWIRAAGARPSVMTPEEHDRAVALTSHLPQVLATSLASMLEAHSDRERLLRSSGPGLLDSTRLALSAWEVWDDILRTNREMIDAAIREHTARLEELRLHLIQDGEVKKIFAEGKRFAEDLRKNRV